MESLVFLATFKLHELDNQCFCVCVCCLCLIRNLEISFYCLKDVKVTKKQTETIVYKIFCHAVHLFIKVSY